MVACNHNIHRAVIFGNRLRGFVNGAVVGVDVGKVHHGIVAVGHDGNDGVDILVAGVGLLMDVVQAEGHVPDGKGDVVAVGVVRVALHNHGGVRHIDHRRAAVCHSCLRLVGKCLVVPGTGTVLCQVVFQVGNVLVFLVVIGGVAVDQISCSA